MSAGVGPRVPKDDFMRALGLEPSDARHEGYYRAMRDEAINTYTQLNADRSNLVEEKQDDPNVRPPFFWHHISRDRQQWAVIETWRNAPRGSIQRTLFDRGSTSGEHAPNWVTLWLLYSVFRSRDIRNNRNRRNPESGSASSTTATGESGTSNLNSSSQPTVTAQREVYDQVRNVHRPR